MLGLIDSGRACIGQSSRWMPLHTSSCANRLSLIEMKGPLDSSHLGLLYVFVDLKDELLIVDLNFEHVSMTSFFSSESDHHLAGSSLPGLDASAVEHSQHWNPHCGHWGRESWVELLMIHLTSSNPDTSASRFRSSFFVVAVYSTVCKVLIRFLLRRFAMFLYSFSFGRLGHCFSTCEIKQNHDLEISVFFDGWGRKQIEMSLYPLTQRGLRHVKFRLIQNPWGTWTYIRAIIGKICTAAR